MWSSARRPFWRTGTAAYAALLLVIPTAGAVGAGDTGAAVGWATAIALALAAAAWAFRVEARTTVGPAGSDARRHRRLRPRTVAGCVAAGVVVCGALVLTVGRETTGGGLLPGALIGTLFAAQWAWRWWAVGEPDLRWRDVRGRRESWRADGPTTTRTAEALTALGAPSDESAGLRHRTSATGATRTTDTTGTAGRSRTP